MSPDGKWIWDGAQWRPIPVHEAAFPNWKSVGAGFVPGVDTQGPAVAVASPPVQRQASLPPSYRMAGPAPGLAVPRWATDSRRASIQKVVPLGIGAAGLIVVIVVATLFLSNRQDSAPTVAPQTGGPTSRSDSALSAYFLKGLGSPMTDLNGNLTMLSQTCRAGLTASCEDSAINLENAIAAVGSVLNKATIPACIATPEAALRSDLAKISEGQKLMLKAFSDLKKTEFSPSYSEVTGYGTRAMTDYAAVKTAAGNCDTMVTGP